MITKNDIKSLDFDNIEQYFEYILLSEINGQRKQVKELIQEMSKAQKKECIKFLQADFFGTEDKNTVLELLHISI